MSFAKVPDRMRANADNSVCHVCRNKAGLGHGLPQAYTPKDEGLSACGCRLGLEFLWITVQKARDTFPTIDVDVQDLEVIS